MYTNSNFKKLFISGHIIFYYINLTYARLFHSTTLQLLLKDQIFFIQRSVQCRDTESLPLRLCARYYGFDLQALALWPFIGLPHLRHFAGLLVLFAPPDGVLEVASKTFCSSAAR